MPNRGEIFAACGNIILAVYNNGESAETSQQISQAKAVILAMMREMIVACEAGKLAKCRDIVHTVLHDLFPNTNYSCDEKLVRDLADLAATLHDVERGIERSSRERLLEVKVFCDLMKNELKVAQ